MSLLDVLIANNFNANIPSANISVGQQCTFDRADISLRHVQNLEAPPAGGCRALGSRARDMTRISDSEKRSFNAQHGERGERDERACRQTKSVGGTPSAAAAGSRVPRLLFSSWPMHTRRPREAGRNAKTSAANPRMIFRTRNEPASRPAA